MILCTEGAIITVRVLKVLWMDGWMDIAGSKTEGQVLPFSFGTQQSIQSLHTINS